MSKVIAFKNRWPILSSIRRFAAKLLLQLLWLDRLQEELSTILTSDLNFVGGELIDELTYDLPSNRNGLGCIKHMNGSVSCLVKHLSDLKNGLEHSVGHAPHSQILAIYDQLSVLTSSGHKEILDHELEEEDAHVDDILGLRHWSRNK